LSVNQRTPKSSLICLLPIYNGVLVASDELPEGECVVHHGTDELLVQHNTIPDGETASLVKKKY